MSRSERGVAVVGAGPAGLAAAWRLASSGRRVRVYESADRVGGRLRTEVVAGVGADAVVQLLSGAYTATRRLVSDLGLAERLVAVPGRDALWRKGGAHALRYGSITSMVTSGALPARLKLRLGLRYVPFLERHAKALDLNEPARAAAAGLDRETIAAWGRAHVGEDFVELLAEPLLASYYGLAPEETSAALFHALARIGMDVEVLGIRSGAGVLAADLARALEERGVAVETGAAVHAVELTDGSARIVLADRTVEHDAVVVAVPPAVASRLLPEAGLPPVRSRPFATLVLATRRAREPGWFGLSVPRSEPEGGVLAAVCVQEEKGTGVVGPEGGALVLVPTAAAGARWAEASGSEVVREALEALEPLLPGVGPDVVEGRLVRLPDGVWLPEPGHFERLAAFRPAALPARLAVAGDYLVAPTVEGAVRSGMAAADRLTAGPA